MKPIKTFAVIVTVLLLASCGGASTTSQSGDKGGEMKIKSPAFEDGKMIPDKYGYNFENISPPLSWSGVPDGTKTLSIISTDPDSPSGEWVHWVVWGLLPVLTNIEEGQQKLNMMINGGIQGVNDFDQIGWDGPSPPSGTHRYVFTLYALDVDLWDSSGANGLKPGFARKDDLIQKMQGHILAKAQLVGNFKK